MNPDSLLVLIYIFVLACFLGFELISKIPPTLHTPLMSASNAVSGITIVGAIVCTGTTVDYSALSKISGFLAIILAAINVVGGYRATDRMLKMFKKKITDK